MSEYKDDVIVDTIKVDKSKLSNVIEKYHALNYVIKVDCEPVIGDFGRYIEHEYKVTVIKPEFY